MFYIASKLNGIFKQFLRGATTMLWFLSAYRKMYLQYARQKVEEKRNVSKLIKS